MIDAEGSELMAEVFNVMTTEQKNSVPGDVAERIGRYMVKNGYRLVFERWYLQAKPDETTNNARRKFREEAAEEIYRLRNALAQSIETVGLLRREGVIPPGYRLQPISEFDALQKANVDPIHDKGIWSVSDDGKQIFSDEQHKEYSEKFAKKLNT